MSERPASRQFDQVAQKWRDLAERRRVYFVELYRSGRWKHYYDEQQFLLQMRTVAQSAETWVLIAPRSADDAMAEPAEQIIETRSAA